MLSFSGAGVVLGGQLLTYAMQGVRPAVMFPFAALNRFPRMVQEFFVERENAIHKERLNRFAVLSMKADAEAYVRTVRENIRVCFGPYLQKIPLNPRVMKVVERDVYTIENVLFESCSGFLVAANLYIPKGWRFLLPGVVASCGHSDNGKAIETYQSFCQGLACLGYVVLIFDPIGQGERMQYVDANLKLMHGTGIGEHNYAGIQQVLVDERFWMWCVWDGIRALDYLMLRKEVDVRYLGIIGNSGGGTMMIWFCGVEDRWTMAVPSCFVTEFRRNMENEFGADMEQCLPRALALGLDHEDFLAALAPKPIIILVKEKDYFDARGNEAVYYWLKHLYCLLGEEDNIAYFVGPMYHGYSQENREAMYCWFNRCTGISDAKAELKLVLEKDEVLLAILRGQVVELKSKTIYGFMQEKSKSLAAKRFDLDGAVLAQMVAEVLRLSVRTGVPEFRILRSLPDRKYPLRYAFPYMVDTDLGVHAIVYRFSMELLLSRPPWDSNKAILYVSHTFVDEELRSERFIQDLIAAEPDAVFYTCDVRGVGDSELQTISVNDRGEYSTDYFYASHAFMLDYPYIGQRTFDVLRVLDWLNAWGYGHIHLVAKGYGALLSMFAALLSADVEQVMLKYALSSYAEVAEARDYSWFLSVLLAGVLTSFDLSDCYRELKKKNLKLLEPWGANPIQVPCYSCPMAVIHMTIPILKADDVLVRLKELRSCQLVKFDAFYSSQLGGIVTDPSVMVLPFDDHMVHRGYGIFDMAGFINGKIYDLEVHLDRFLLFAERSKLKILFSCGEMRDIIVKTTAASGRRDGSIRYWLSLGPGSFELTPVVGSEPGFFVMVFAGFVYLDRWLMEGARVMTTTYPIKVFIYAMIKATNYLPNVLMQMEAKEVGFDTGVFIDENRYVGEGSNMNVAFVTNDAVLIHPKFDHILAGCTLLRLLELANVLRDRGLLYAIEVRDIPVVEARASREMFFMGSSVKVVAIVQWDDQVIGDGKLGPVAKVLLQLLDDDMRSVDRLIDVPY